MKINADKSEVISPSDSEWQLFDDERAPVLSLKQVATYKYLGTPIYGSMYRTSLNKQRQCIVTANKYKGSCIYVSKNGPDMVDVALCTWSNIAIPAILTGCEMIPFSESTLDSIERVQSQISKFVLGVPVSTANICAQTELGLKSFQQLLWERQLKFFFRVLFMPETRWARAALGEHLSGVWPSPYYNYIFKLRSDLQLFDTPPSVKILKTHISDWFIARLNSSITRMDLPCVHQVLSLQRSPYVCESSFAVVIAEFKLANAGLGNREPRQGHIRQLHCPLCPIQTPNTEFHLVIQCPSLSVMRATTNISSFISACRLKNIPFNRIFDLFVNGKDSDSDEISPHSYLERGKCLADMRQLWLSKW